MTKLRKKLQDKLRKKYNWHSSRRCSSDYGCFLYKFIKGPWAFKHPELGRSTIGIDYEVDGVLGDIYVTVTEEYCESNSQEHDRSIGFALTFEELEHLYLISKEIEENRKRLKK